MKEILLACDLDNTLIYSYKHRVPGDSCVEWLDGQEQSFMTERTQALLRQLPANVRLVPVTTRSKEQYQRICWPKLAEAASPQWAVCSNGGLLLAEGAPEPAWQMEAARLVAPYEQVLAELAWQLRELSEYKRCKMVDDIYLYTVCQDVAEAEQCLADFYGFGGLQVVRGGRKVYFLPPEINKGAAVQRLRQRWPEAVLVAAGDSELDLSMLEEADLALLPNEALAEQLVNPWRLVCPPEAHFAEFVLEKATQMQNNKKSPFSELCTR